MTSPPPQLTAALADRYRLDRELGQGGMATVYLAHDLKHDRDVAIKVLHPDLGAALGGERFLAEIRTTAKLQHPHILPLLDSGSADGLFYYVMPLVTGETLRARLERERQLPIAEAVRLAREVASALDYAHRQGIIHRDIKPENILLHDGQAIVADFGIALAVQTAGGARMTQTGLSLGTPQYMSPEQAMGERTIDARSDVYALGAVTYEMLAGEPPFTGPSVQAIVAKVLSERPVALHTVRDTVPASIEQAILAALAKLPADRPASAAAFVAMLSESAATSAPFAAPGATRPRAGRQWAGVAGGAIVGALAAAAAVGGVMLRRPSPSPSVVRFSMPGGASNQFGTRQMALSADGRMITYADPSDAAPGIRVRRVDRDVIDVVPGTEAAAVVTFAPDGHALAYANRGTPAAVHTVGIDGQTPVRIASPATAPGSVAWGDDGYVYFVEFTSISRVPAAGGKPEVLMTQAQEAVKTTAKGAFQSLVLLERGTWLVSATRGEGATDGDILLIDVAAKTRTVLGRGIAAIGVRDGWLLYARIDGSVMAQRLDLPKRALLGTAIPVLDGVFISDYNQAIAMGADGSLVYVPEANAASKLTWVSRDGIESEVDSSLMRAFASPALSPAGDRIAVSIAEGGSGAIWLYDLQRRTLARMTARGEAAIRPQWTPDGARVLFASDHGSPGQRRIFSLAPDGGDSLRVVVSRTRLVQEVSWPAGGTSIAFREGYSDGMTMRDIFAMVPGDTAARAVVATKADEASPAVSPDGRWLAYTSDASGRVEAYVTPFPGGGARIQLSTNGGQSPVWSRDGRELFYRDGNGMLVATAMNTGAANPIGASRPLFSATRFLEDGTTARSFDVAPDGRFLFVKPQRRSLSVVLGWWTEAAATLATAERQAVVRP